MKKIFITFIILLLTPFVFVSAEENEKTPDMSIGITANFGSFDMFQKNMDLDIQPGIYTGAGISLEKQIHSIFNFGTGIQYRYFNSDFIMKDNIQEFESKWTMQSINIPFLFILSFSGEESALNLVGGVVYSHVFYSVMKTDDNVTLQKYTDNVQRLTNSNQIGLTGGIIFKIKSTKYTDFLFGVMGEYYPTNLVSDTSGRLQMINYSFTTGYMFRTNIFPGSK